MIKISYIAIYSYLFIRIGFLFSVNAMREFLHGVNVYVFITMVLFYG